MGRKRSTKNLGESVTDLNNHIKIQERRKLDHLKSKFTLHFAIQSFPLGLIRSFDFLFSRFCF